jgi:hypothetical protein
MTKKSQLSNSRTMKSRIKNLKRKQVAPTECKIASTHMSERRIISYKSLMDIISVTQNHCKKCVNSSLSIHDETWVGIDSTLHLKCECCNRIIKISCDSEHNSLPVNEASVLGTIEGGGGYQSQFDYLKTLDIPPMSFRCYQRHELQLTSTLQTSTYHDILKNGQEELELALKDPNTIYYDNIPGISVTCDGGWGKRSYGHTFNSLSGCAVILGNKTGKILHLGIRNKYCHSCVVSPNKTGEEHTCFKNYEGSSSSMETDIILQGFLESKANHGLIYNNMLADQDSSVFATVSDAMKQKYSLVVTKTNCVNHAMKNLKKKFYKMLTATKVYTIVARHWLKRKIEKFVIACKCAIKYNHENVNSDSDWLSLRNDILNCPFHYAGNHNNCRAYFCHLKTVKEEKDIINNKCFWDDLVTNFSQLADLAQSLIQNMRTNRAESFMSIVSKYIGGKRKNLYMKNQYQTRVYLAAKSHKKGEMSNRLLYKFTYNRSPSVIWGRRAFAKRRPRVHFI